MTYVAIPAGSGGGVSGVTAHQILYGETTGLGTADYSSDFTWNDSTKVLSAGNGTNTFQWDAANNTLRVGASGATGDLEFRKSLANNTVSFRVAQTSSSGVSEAQQSVETAASGGRALIQCLASVLSVGVEFIGYGHTVAGNLWGSGPAKAASAHLRKNQNGGAGDMAISTHTNAEKVILATNVGSTPNNYVQLLGNGSFEMGVGRATTDTTGFPCFPSCAGVPTGVPAGLTANLIASVYDRTNDEDYRYNAGWINVDG